jgi:hypothetical protein
MMIRKVEKDRSLVSGAGDMNSSSSLYRPLRYGEARLLAHVQQLLLQPKFMRLLTGLTDTSY